MIISTSHARQRSIKTDPIPGVDKQGDLGNEIKAAGQLRNM